MGYQVPGAPITPITEMMRTGGNMTGTENPLLPKPMTPDPSAGGVAVQPGAPPPGVPSEDPRGYKQNIRAREAKAQGGADPITGAPSAPAAAPTPNTAVLNPGPPGQSPQPPPAPAQPQPADPSAGGQRQQRPRKMWDQAQALDDA